MRRVISSSAVCSLTRSNVASCHAAVAGSGNGIASINCCMKRSRSSPSLSSLCHARCVATIAPNNHNQINSSNNNNGRHTATKNNSSKNATCSSSTPSQPSPTAVPQQRRMMAAAAARRREPIPQGCLHRPVRRVVILSKVTLIDEVARGTLHGVSEGQLATLKMMALDKDAHCVEARKEHLETVQAVEDCLAQVSGLEKMVVERVLPEHTKWGDLLISVGGDGTFLRGARMIDEQCDMPIIGVNSSPSSSFGFFCAATRDTFGNIWNKLADGQCKLSDLWRMRVFIDGKPHPTLALNEALVAPDSPAATARYVLKVDGHSQKQHSSGIWISTAAGSTGAISSAGGTPMSLDSRDLQYRIRELFPLSLKGSSIAPIRGGIVPADFQIASRMVAGGLYLDGSLKPSPLPFGATLTFAPADRPLKWVAPIDRHHRVTDNWKLLTGGERPPP